MGSSSSSVGRSLWRFSSGCAVQRVPMLLLRHRVAPPPPVQQDIVGVLVPLEAYIMLVLHSPSRCVTTWLVVPSPPLIPSGVAPVEQQRLTPIGKIAWNSSELPKC